MNYAVVITKPAEADLAGIGDYIAFQLKEPDTAVRLLGKLQAEILKLAEFPTRRALVREEEFRAQGYRKLFVEHYTVFFTCSEQARTVYIHRVLYNKRNWVEII